MCKVNLCAIIMDRWFRQCNFQDTVIDMKTGNRKYHNIIYVLYGRNLLFNRYKVQIISYLRVSFLGSGRLGNVDN
jgi:hypothetical protein